MSRRTIAMLALIIAGEAVFMLPFVVARVFRSAFLAVFGLSNLQLGSAFSVYGIVAMVSYLLGGPLADRFAARTLITVALVATAAGGIVFASIPSIPMLIALYGYWGLTTILLFWAALIRATREWGAEDAQGRAYGVLDGGRGLLAALLASAAVVMFAQLLPLDVSAATAAQRSSALRAIIVATTAFTVLAAALSWFALPPATSPATTGAQRQLNWIGVRAAARLPTVWLQAIAIVCAYVAYKVTDNFGLYAHDVLGYDDIASARLGALTFWTRPVAALGAGLLADRIGGTRTLAIGFILLAGGAAALGAGLLPVSVPLVLFATIVVTCLGIYGVRGVYYAVMNEMRLPLAITGSAVGLVSVIGYTPDVFAGPLIGALLDHDPGAVGYQHVFFMTAGFAVVGLASAVAMHYLTKRP
ncbi:nitrate/nitrite transporter [uncultured Nevskia sp.]|uniref:MFS transporter n=1 Tax=uncultured Nevskia sp. TaxID=228950 RepID=UPI0025DBF342|nr:MFS transporter [uncultured Nevskia sp.]